MHENISAIREEHGAITVRATSNRRSVAGIHRRHGPVHKPTQSAFRDSPTTPDTVLAAPGVDPKKTRRSSDSSPPPRRAPPTRGPPLSRRHSMVIPSTSNNPIQINIRRQSNHFSPPRPSDRNSKKSEIENHDPIRRRSFVGRHIQETTTAHNRESERSQFCQYSRRRADEGHCFATKDNLSRRCKDNLKWKIERRGSISSGHDTKCSSSSESDGSRDTAFCNGGSLSNDLVVRRLSVDDAPLFGPSISRLQEQFDSLNSVVTDSNSRIRGRKVTVHRSRSMEVSSNHGMVSTDNARKIMRSSELTLSRAQSTGTSSSRKSNSKCFPPPPPPRPRSHPQPREISISGVVTRQLGLADSIHHSRSCGMDSELIGGSGKFSCASKHAPSVKRSTLAPQILETHPTNEFIIANKTILERIQRSNQVTSMPYTDTMGESGLYTGEIDRESRLPHGRGKMKYENGIFYEGKWVNGAQDVHAAIQRERILSGFTSWKGKSGKGGGRSDGIMTTKVYGLKWVDFHGMSGKYTGAMNKDDVPHGYGKLCYDFGLIAEGNWVHGVLDDGAGMAAFGASMGMGIGGSGATVFGGALTPRSGSRSVFEAEGTVVSGLGMMSVGGHRMKPHV